MIRSSYADPSGVVGNRDFSRGWSTPAKADSVNSLGPRAILCHTRAAPVRVL